MSQKLFIDEPHEFQILRLFGKRRSGSVVRRAWQMQQITLPFNSQPLVSALYAFDFL
jgi:putative heme degradation protein